MKKSLSIIGIVFLLFIISACQANTDQEVQDSGQNTAEERESDVSGETSEPSSEESNGGEKHNNDNSANQATDTSYEYEEQEVIETQIDDGEYEVVVETDNPGTRVLFYEIGGEKYYKTIFVKNENRLKIIDIQNNNSQIYNETI
ncbi:hypothetical protein [Oceanobacillus sp. J11TS1]|uniref:hypothetical protein n=1 Tax=Oceanobacillus sp. J11TS1 TaxID=2807191 RepID=UPI001B22D317|nr:hypothetical protein [Oceanobacillus sp. J11TS1]GIO23320.1 hypothetical protein J11TS1_19010 [Oceanobacillus sp. J11TS1]